MKANKFFELLIKWLEGKMTGSKLAEKLGMSYSQAKIYLDEISKHLDYQFKEGYKFGRKEKE